MLVLSHGISGRDKENILPKLDFRDCCKITFTNISLIKGGSYHVKNIGRDLVNKGRFSQKGWVIQ